MSEWKEYKISDIADVIGGGTPSTSNSSYWNGNIPWLTPRDLTGYTKVYISKGERNITVEGLRNSSARLLPKGTVLLTSRAPIGYVAIAKNEITTNQGFKSLVLKEDYADNEFIYYWIKNNIDYLQSIGTGTTFAEISGRVVKDIEISLPPLSEQKSITSVLSSLDDKIDLLHRQNTTLEKMAEALFRQWFVEEADDEWEEITFGDFVIPKKGKNITKSEAVDGHYPVVAGGLEPSCYHNEANTKSPVITISASGANAGYVKLYTIPVWSSDSSYIDETITPYVYFSYIFLKVNQSQLSDKQEGSAQPHIYPRHIMELDTLDYPENLVCSFEESVRPFFLKIKSNQTQIRTLTSLRDTLLPKLMSGEVRVEMGNINKEI